MPEEIRKKLRDIGVNQAGAYEVAKTIYKLYIDDIKNVNDAVSFEKWCNYKYEEAPYDEFE